MEIDLHPRHNWGVTSLQQELLALYAELDRELEPAQAACRACGECCDFPKQGFLLFATSAEAELAARCGPPPASWPDRERCPFHVDGRCLNRRGRPLGCRTYFCDPAAEEQGRRVYADYHDRIKRTIERCAAEYRYGPFLHLLAEAWGMAPGVTS